MTLVETAHDHVAPRCVEQAPR